MTFEERATALVTRSVKCSGRAEAFDVETDNSSME
jgi:hypothetical protein